MSSAHILTLRRGQLVVNASMTPEALRRERPTRAGCDEAADIIEALLQEVEVLRRFGNKDCTQMADQELARLRTEGAAS